FSSSFFFKGAPPTATSSLSLHDALPIFWGDVSDGPFQGPEAWRFTGRRQGGAERRHRLVVAGEDDLLTGRQLLNDLSQVAFGLRSEEHTSELQSLTNLVCRPLLEKKKHT